MASRRSASPRGEDLAPPLRRDQGRDLGVGQQCDRLDVIFAHRSPHRQGFAQHRPRVGPWSGAGGAHRGVELRVAEPDAEPGLGRPLGEAGDQPPHRVGPELGQGVPNGEIGEAPGQLVRGQHLGRQEILIRPRGGLVAVPQHRQDRLARRMIASSRPTRAESGTASGPGRGIRRTGRTSVRRRSRAAAAEVTPQPPLPVRPRRGRTRATRAHLSRRPRHRGRAIPVSSWNPAATTPASEDSGCNGVPL